MTDPCYIDILGCPTYGEAVKMLRCQDAFDKSVSIMNDSNVIKIELMNMKSILCLPNIDQKQVDNIDQKQVDNIDQKQVESELVEPFKYDNNYYSYYSY